MEKGEDGESGFGVVATGGREEGEISFHPLCFREEKMSVTKKAEIWHKGGTTEGVELCPFKDKSVPPHP